ncbi:MAG: ring-cleaving dioxygenase [Rubrobacter sp.]|nr:ring-cleaving dioxygenase [Rubrobacter sp.]
MGSVRGIHHVTAIAGDPQRNADFYAGVLGLRLVKKTVNFDDPTTYHLYYGDAGGSPGTIMTFFPWGDLPRGKVGAAQVTATAFAVPEGSAARWLERLREAGVTARGPQEEGFDRRVVLFEDPDGLRLKLVESPVPEESGVRGFHHAVLCVRRPERTLRLLTETLGFSLVAEAEGRWRLAAGDGPVGRLVDVVDGAGVPLGRMGVGTVHHIAFRVPDEEAQRSLREEVAALGYNVTPVIDRKYFRSVYFREPGGVLFEIATDPPGFAVDEPREELGSRLQLPPWLEGRREEIERSLPPVLVPSGEPA